MSMLDKLTDRVLALLGLDVDVPVSMGRDPFNAIAHDIYLGARPDRTQASALRNAGVTHVVSCLPEDARNGVAFLEGDFHTLFIPMHDGIHEDIASTFPAFFDFVRSATERDRGAKVFVHCEVGVSRSATLVTALLMRRRRKRFFEAYCDVRAERPEVLPNIGFASQLQRWEFKIFAETPDDPPTSSLARYLVEICKVPVDLATLQAILHRNEYDALRAIQAIFGDEVPRVVQGVRS